jgi:predicted nucleic acid-binding protein
MSSVRRSGAAKSHLRMPAQFWISCSESTSVDIKMNFYWVPRSNWPLRHRSLYDCLYLTLALRLRMRLVTADRRLLDALIGTVFASHVLWVEDVP